MRENRTSGSVRGALGNRRSYRESLKTELAPLLTSIFVWVIIAINTNIEYGGNYENHTNDT